MVTRRHQKGRFDLLITVPASDVTLRSWLCAKDKIFGVGLGLEAQALGLGLGHAARGLGLGSAWPCLATVTRLSCRISNGETTT